MLPKTFQMTAQTMFGLEDVLEKELQDLGVKKIQKHNRAVSFEGDLRTLYQTNLCLRTALRILIPITDFKVHNEEDLYKKIKKIAWEDYLSADDTLAINAKLNTKLFTHSRYIEQKTKDAIVDRFREKFDKRPSVDIENPTLRIQLFVNEDTCLVLLNSSGSPLYKRGYREKTNLAPINETLAAGLILLSGWDKKSNFVDPMCGSGTILIEAALIAGNIPAGSFRESFGFENWKNFDVDLWEEVFDEAMDNVNTSQMPLIVGSEISSNVARKALGNIGEANLKKFIELQNTDFKELVPPPRPAQHTKGVMIINPPYGERMDKDDDILDFYKQIGDTLKKNWAGYDAWIITSNQEAAKSIGLRAKPKIKVFNGALECRFMRFELYEGSKK